MPKLSGINHQRAVKAFERKGFWIARQGKHLTMTDGERIITIPQFQSSDYQKMKSRLIPVAFSW